MKINIIAVGKIKEKYIKMGIAEILKRLSHYSKINIIEVNDEKIPANHGEKDLDILKEKEGERILTKIPAGSYVIVLDVKGKEVSSEELSHMMGDLMLKGKSEISFIIGGAVGLHKKVIEKADFVLSFSKMTFTHQMIRLILLEQVYRAFKIMKGEPYHK